MKTELRESCESTDGAAAEDAEGASEEGCNGLAQHASTSRLINKIIISDEMGARFESLIEENYKLCII